MSELRNDLQQKGGRRRRSFDSYRIPCMLYRQDTVVVIQLLNYIARLQKFTNISFKWTKVTLKTKMVKNLLVYIQNGMHHFLVKRGATLYLRDDLSMKRVTLVVVCRSRGRTNTVSLIFEWKRIKANKVGLKSHLPPPWCSTRGRDTCSSAWNLGCY